VLIDYVSPQRSTFENRFQADVQIAIDRSLKLGSGGSQYIAPPSGSPSSSTSTSRPPPIPSRSSNSTSQLNRHDSYRPLPPPPPPTIAVQPPEEESTTLMLIRETLFAALGDCLATNKDLLSLIQGGDKSWSSRCYFASLCLAILDVCLFRVCLPALPDVNHILTGNQRRDSFPWNEAFVKTVHVSSSSQDNKVSLENCPQPLTKLLYSVLRIGMFVQSLSEADDQKAIQDASQGQPTLEESLYIYRLKRKLLGDVVTTQVLPSDEKGEEYVKEANVMINRLALGE
jgi:hypothetical protein